MTTLTEQDRRAYQANVWKSYLYQFLLAFQLWWPIWVIYLQEKRGFSLTEISSLEGLFWLATVVAEVPTGAVADRYGRKTSLILASLFNAGGILVFGLASEYPIVLASYLAWAVGVTFQSGAYSALVFDSLKMLRREDDFQKIAGRFWAINWLGILGGGLAGAPLAAATDLAFPIVVSAGVALLSLGVAASLREPAAAMEGELTMGYARLIRESVRTAGRLPPIRYILLLSAVLAVVAWAPMIFVQPFLVGHGVEVGNLGFLQAPNRLLAMAGALGAYRLSAWLGTRATFFAVPAAVVACYTVLGAWDSVYAYTVFPMAAFANSLFLPVVTDYLNRRIPSSQRATILSLRQLSGSLTIALSQPLLGLIADQSSLIAVFWTLAALLALCTPPALILWLRAHRAEERHGHAAGPA